MRRVLALVALWLLFAVTGVAAGFGAARFLDGPAARAAPGVVADGEVRRTTPSTAGPPSATSGTAPTVAPSASTPATPDLRSRGTTLGIDTLAGYASGTCTGSSIRMSASPKAGWEVTELSAPGRLGEAEFEQTRAPGGKIAVHAWCEGGRPTFVVDDTELRPRSD